MAYWTFLTNHGRILLCVARDPGVRHRDLADRVGITERAAQRIVADLVEAGYLDVIREGRRNHYRLHPELPMRHLHQHDHQVGEILAVLQPTGDAAATGGPSSATRSSWSSGGGSVAPPSAARASALDG